jgi:hypothetical protein
MTTSKEQPWEKGNGGLGVLDPLIGSWTASADSPMGSVQCRRTFSRILGDSCVLLEARWRLPGDQIYEEHAVYSAGDDGTVAFWSFTSDGKRSQGALADATDIHAEAIAFEAQMPAGLARMVYWPGGEGVVNWAAESKSPTGWSRFAHHRCTAI